MNVVSFFAPRPEHPFYQDYTPFLNLLRLSCERFGHRHIVLTDDASVGEDAYVTELPRPLMSAFLAAQLAYLADPQFADVPTLFVGADCVLARDPACFADEPGDIVITTCDAFTDCRMNTGAIFVPKPQKLAHAWATAIGYCEDNWGDDQRSLYRAICESPLVVSELPVDPYNLAPEHPHDDCTRGVVLHFRGPRKGWMVDYCKTWLDLGEGIGLTVGSNASAERVIENVRVNAARTNCITVNPRPAHGAHAVLVGGGPSAADMLPEIRRRVEDGQHIFALNGAARWLEEHGIRAEYCVILDTRERNAEFVGHADVHLLASQCHPAVFDAVAHLSVSMWHFADPEIWPTIQSLPNGKDLFAVSGGISVGLTAMCLVYMMGYRKIHLYGYDSSDAEGRHHAYDQAQTSAEERRFEVWCDGKPFIASACMYAQARDFPVVACKLVEEGAIITVHGSGLLPTLAHQMNASTPITEDMAA